MGTAFQTALDLAPVAAVLLLVLATWLTWATLAARGGSALEDVVPTTPARELRQPADAQLPAPRRAHHDTHQDVDETRP